MIAVDANILIWGLEKTPSCESETASLAVRFFEYVQAEKIPVTIPANALGEFLAKGSEDERNAVHEKLLASYPIAPYDAIAAAIAGDLASNKNVVDEVRQARPRPLVKFDIAIIASSIAYGADRIITENEKEMRKLAQGRIIVQSLSDFLRGTVTANTVVEPSVDGHTRSQGILFREEQEEPPVGDLSS